MSTTLVVGVSTIAGIVACVIVYSSGFGGLVGDLIAVGLTIPGVYIALFLSLHSRKAAAVGTVIAYVILVLVVGHYMIATADGLALNP